MISIFGEDSLWKKITLLADVQIEKDDHLPQQVCITCAKNTISACLFKKKCEDADNFFRQQLLIRKIDGQNSIKVCSDDIITLSEEELSDKELDTDGVNKSGNSETNAEGSKTPIGEKQHAFDFNSIRLMHEYMQQHLSKINGIHSAGSGSDGPVDDDDPLPLIPEIELLTPSEEIDASVSTSVCAKDAELRGYQCTVCYQIFEVKQILKHHMHTVHGASGAVYECTNCKKTYFYKRFLEKHVRRGRCVKKRRNQTRPMQCSDCHTLFPTGHHLGWHKRTGCPSRAAKMPLQQLLKQNIVQYNNFPKRIGIRKPENAIYLHNRKLIMANNKRKGRTRIKLDAKKIALAKQLILREATTTVIANELNISRTFAWRLRKSLVNGVSLHERVVDPTNEEQADAEDLHDPQPQLEQFHETACIKSEQMNSYSDEDGGDPNECRSVSTDCDFNSIRNRIGIERDNDNNVSDDDNKNEGTMEAEKNTRDQQFVQRVSEESQISGGNSDVSDCNQIHTYTQPKNYSDAGHTRDLNFKNNFQQDHPMLNGFPSAVVAAISHQLPVNLSIKPITSLQNAEATSNQLKKPRKPNVFIDDEKYALAKMLVAQNSSTMEIARQLNVSQMTAWKVRDAIVKGIPLSYRTKREMREAEPQGVIQLPTSPSPNQHKTVLQMSSIQEITQSLQQQNDMQTIRPSAQNATVSAPKAANSRRRLKAAEREMRDKEITREILEMIKADSSIQYWKVSARLAEKGFPISPSSVCQKLKSMGIHRRWKPGDKPPMLDLEHLKTNSVGDGSLNHDSGNEHQFDLGGAHFLSAFTH